MTLRVNPDTRRRRSHSQDEDRQQFLVTIGFIVVVVLALVALIGAVGSTYYNQHLKSVAKVAGTDITVDAWADRAKLISYRISLARARLREAAGSGEISATDEATKSSELDTKDQSASDDALEGLIDQAYQATLAAPRKLTVSAGDIDAAQLKESSLPEHRHVLAIFVEPKAATAGGTPTTADTAAALANAEKALVDLNAGKPFADVARQYSTDASKDRDGDFGTITASNATDDAWIKAVFDLPSGGTTDVIKGADGIYRIGRVSEITPGGEDPNFMPELQKRLSTDAYRKNLAGELLSDKLIAAVVGEVQAGAKDQVHVSEIFVADDSAATASPAPGDPTPAPDEGQVKVRHILYSPKSDPTGASALPSDDPGWTDALTKAQATVDKLKAITDIAARETEFEALAKSESDDKGSGADGGQLAFTARSGFVKAFSDAIFDGQHSLGEIIGPVRSEFGYHVIFWQAKRGPAADRIKQIDDQLKSPTADFAAIAKDQSEGPTADSGGDLGWQTKDQLPTEAADAIWALQAGGVTANISQSDGAHWYKVTERAQRPLDADQVATLTAPDATSGRPKAFEDWYTPQKDQAETDGIIDREAGAAPANASAGP